MTLNIGAQKVTAQAEEDIDRTTSNGKASSVQFIHFPLTVDQKLAFQNSETLATVGIEHSNYEHVSVIPESMRRELRRDLI